MAALQAVLLAPLLALCRAGPGPAPAARVEVAVSGPGPGAGAGSGAAGGAGAAAGAGGSYTLRGAVLGAGGGRAGPGRGVPRGGEEEIRGRLLLVGHTEPELGAADSWIGVVPVGEEPAEVPRGAKEESFTAAVVSKMKRALVLGASALLILALNQNAIRELDVSQLLAKPVIVIQSSDNVTKLLGALLRGLQATAKITYQAVLLENLGVTLTLWSTCGLSRGGLYGEWQGVICTGENSSQVQKYLQQLWNTILLIALLLCTGVIVQAQRQSRQDLSEQDAELDLKQHIRQRLLALKTRRYHPSKALRSQACEIDSCAVCLDQFHKSQWLRVLPCSHEFHRDCVDPWLLLQQTCPLCKRNILGNCCTES
ncbi:RING finger protein 215 [Falco peregrinus]|uniref:RING finger protein 215 n=1 Tax=Falco peregrinus TaxID=8954 RepID=UPI00247A8438|nr:RING finger protein 215 [Falco peregrinus]